MSLGITVKQSGSVSLVDVTGRITMGEGASTLRDTLLNLPREGHKNILLNLAEVTSIDSTGLGVLVAGFASITNRGGELKLLNLPVKIRDLLLLTKLFTVFEVFENETIAIHSFADAEAELPAAHG
jgi:anti-sigma B factor antagonist